jgi:small-conductance mechanosensitive channel
MLWTILAFFVICWLVGFSFRIADGLAYILLGVVLVVVILNLLCTSHTPTSESAMQKARGAGKQPSLAPVISV